MLALGAWRGPSYHPGAQFSLSLCLSFSFCLSVSLSLFSPGPGTPGEPGGPGGPGAGAGAGAAGAGRFAMAARRALRSSMSESRASIWGEETAQERNQRIGEHVGGVPYSDSEGEAGRLARRSGEGGGAMWACLESRVAHRPLPIPPQREG